MTFGSRWVLLMTLPVALTLTGCHGKRGISRAGLDSGTPVSGTPNPDSAASANPNADAAVATLTVSPPSVDFGSFDVGASKVVVVTITNTGTALSGPLNVTVVGAGITASGCQRTTLAPYATCEIFIRASLTSAAIIDGAVEVGDGLANAPRISVTGFGVTPGMRWSLAPSRLDLGPVPVGKTETGTVVMTGNSLVAFTGLAISVSGTGFSLSPTGTCTDTLAAGQSCDIVVSFTAGPTPGPAQGIVTVRQGGALSAVQVTATVVSTGPSLQLTPQAGSFQTTVGTPSFPLTFYVSGDVGSSALTVTITGTHKSDFSFTTNCDQPRAGDVTSACQVVVVYMPKTAPTTTATATLAVAEPGGASATAALTGTVTQCELPTISASNTDFGSVVVGTASNPLSFTIVNPATQDAHMQISVGEPQFVIAFDGCSGESLESGQRCSFSVQFKPVLGDAGIIQGRLKALFGSGPCSTAWLDVRGTAIPVGAMDAGVAEAGPTRFEVGLPYRKDALDFDTPSQVPPGGATIVVSPGSIDFGAMDVDATSPPAAVTVTNVDAVASAPLYVTVDGAGIIVSGCSGTQLAPQGSCTLTIRVNPAVAGVISGTVTVGDGPSNSREIPVMGLAVSPGQMLSLSTNNLDLGPVLTGKTASGTIVMSNNALGNATGIVINVAGTGFGLLPSGTCTDTLAVGQTCDIDVGFTAGPTSGLAKGTVVVSVGGRSMAVALSATVQTPAKLIMTPTAASFTTTTGTPSFPLTFYVTNAGDVSSAIPSVSISGFDKDDFSFTTTCATAMAGGATALCQVVVIYTPQASRTSNASATLTVAEPGLDGSSATASLTGIAVSP